MAKRERNRRVQESESFWDRPVLMNLVADVLIAVSLLLLAWAAVTAVKRLPLYPLRELVVVSNVARVSPAQIEHAARTALAGNLLSVNIEEARQAFEKLPWVRRAELRRRWPDALELSIEEHVATARWLHPDGSGESRLVNTQGELFAATGEDSLPAFTGPEGSAALMLERFRDFKQRLAASQRKPVALTLSPRAAWQVQLDNGSLVDLGRESSKLPLADRTDRFVTHYAAALNKAGMPLAVADMRYPNGFVLRPATPAVQDRKSNES